MNPVAARVSDCGVARRAGTIALLLAVLVLIVPTVAPVTARSGPTDGQIEPPITPRDPTTEMILEDAIAPGINHGTGGFGTATVIVPKGYWITYVVRTEPVHAGKTLIIWTRSAGGKWRQTATQPIADDGTVHYVTRVQAWTGFVATWPGGSGIGPVAARGKIAAVAATPFTIEVFPPELPTANRRAIGGERYVFLVRLHDTAGCTRPVYLSATAAGARVTIERRWLACGVAEVTVVPPAVDEEKDLRVVIRATRGDVTTAVVRTIPVIPGEDLEAAEAMRHLKLFLPWLAAHHPELGITPATRWRGTSITHLLVVTHYMFVSDRWEIVVSWHNMIPPYDWTRIFLRHRWTEAWPSRAYEISSIAAHDKPHAIAPPDAITR